MTPFDYAVGLITILVGLALADVCVSLHKLLRLGRSVRWDGRVILSVAFVITLITGMWFSVWSIRTVGVVLRYPFYLTLFLEFMMLFLVCAACLPDDAAENRDLKVFYEGNRRYLWTLFALFQTSFLLHWIYFQMDPAGHGPTHRGSPLVAGAMVFAPAVVFLLLAFIRARRFHYGALVALLIFYLYVYWRATLAV
jgi:hypothetical protein